MWSSAVTFCPLKSPFFRFFFPLNIRVYFTVMQILADFGRLRLKWGFGDTAILGVKLAAGTVGWWKPNSECVSLLSDPYQVISQGLTVLWLHIQHLQQLQTELCYVQLKILGGICRGLSSPGEQWILFSSSDTYFGCTLGWDRCNYVAIKSRC